MNEDFLASAKPVAAKDDFLSNAKPVAVAPAQPEGFWHSLGAQLGLTPEAAEATRQEILNHPLKSLAKAAGGPAVSLAESLYGQAKQTGSELYQAGKSLVSGNPAEAAVHGVGAVPIVGQAMVKGATSAPLTPGSYMHQVGEAASDPSTMGTLTGAAIQAAPVVAGAVDAAAPTRPVIPNPPVMRTIGRAALLGKTPEEAYGSALKPSTTLSQEQRAAFVKTGLDEGLPVSKAGLDKLSDLLDDYNQKIKAVIDTDPARPIDPNKVANRADMAKRKFAMQVNAGADLDAIDASRRQFLNEQGATPGNPAPPMRADTAQAMKQGTYETLKGKYGEQVRASEEAQKALARGLKEEIATQFPEINSLNASESRLLDLQPALERAVNRISNHQSVGIGTPIAGAAAKAVTGSGSVGMVTGVLKAVLDNPALKSRLAIALSKGAKIPMSQAISRVQAYSVALGSGALGSRAYSSGDTPNQPETPQP